MAHTGANWNQQNDHYTQTFWEQNTKQFWLDTEFPVSKDKKSWYELSDNEQITYVQALSGLTVFDTKQGGDGMPLIGLHETDDQRKAVFSFMGTMEHIHAKSYSKIFQTLLSDEQIDYFLDQWVAEQPQLQYKVDKVLEIYHSLWKPNATLEERYKAKVASVFLETFLFYSGFFYPLYLAGQGKMTTSGEIIDLIIRDESIHGVYTGVTAQEHFKEFSPEKQDELTIWVRELLVDLYENELGYTLKLYSKVNLKDEVNKFLKFNANRAMMNLGFEPIFEEVEINPIVENGLSTETKTHDFFSKKGSGYFKANVQPITNETFNFKD